MGLKRNRIPTWTNLVLEYLRKVDDFKSVAEIAQATGITKQRVNVGLWNLHNHNAVMMLESNGRTYWGARPELDDNRSRVVLERVEELNPRKKRLRPAKK